MIPTTFPPSPQASSGITATTAQSVSTTSTSSPRKMPCLQEGTIITKEEGCSLYCRRIATEANAHLPIFHPHPDLKRHLDIVLTLAKKQMGDDLSCLNNESIYSMASGLYAAEINTLEEAEKLGLIIVPPGPVFHTWYALIRTTLFNGQNNIKGYNYVETIKKEADFFRKFQLPVLLIYSILEMTDEQTQIMSQLFSEHDNIITLCLETDFPKHQMTTTLATRSDYICERSDDIRFMTLQHKDEVLKKAAAKARSSGKLSIANSLESQKSQTLVYSDIDNIIIRPDLYIMTSLGAIGCNNPHFPNMWTIVTQPFTPDQKILFEKFTSYVEHVQQNHCSFLSNPTTACVRNDKLHAALLSGFYKS